MSIDFNVKCKNMTHSGENQLLPGDLGSQLPLQEMTLGQEQQFSKISPPSDSIPGSASSSTYPN